MDAFPFTLNPTRPDAALAASLITLPLPPVPLPAVLRRQRVSAKTLCVLINLELAVLDLAGHSEVNMIEVRPGVGDDECNWRAPNSPAMVRSARPSLHCNCATTSAGSRLRSPRIGCARTSGGTPRARRSAASLSGTRRRFVVAARLALAVTGDGDLLGQPASRIVGVRKRRYLRVRRRVLQSAVPALAARPG